MARTEVLRGTVETEWRAKRAFVRGSYTWSKYYGNFDQDNSTTGSSNDENIFIGSSNIGDGAGRQLWNFKDGTLRGDRPHMLKLYGFYSCRGTRRLVRSRSRSRVSRGKSTATSPISH